MGSPRLEDLVRRNAASMPQRTALVDRRRAVTHSQVLAEAEGLAAALQRRGIVPGDRVAVIAPNRIELIVAAFACFVGGFVFQPVNYRLSAAEVTNVLDDAGTAAALVDRAAFPHHAELLGRRAGLRALGLLGEDTGVDWGDGAAADAFVAPAEPSPLAALLYTGGTTGRPKGTVLSHAAWLHAARDGACALRLWRHDVSFMCIPLFHVSFVHFLSTYYVGAVTRLSERVRPDEVLDAIVRHGATHTVMVQATLVDLLERVEHDPVALGSLKVLQYGASPIAPSIIERVVARFGNVLLQSYGSTEAGGAVTCLPPEDHDPARAGERWAARIASAGHALPGAELRVVGPDGRALPTGERGEVLVRAPSLMEGYWGDKAASREALTDDGWLRTGDIGVLDEDGYLSIVDRVKDMIISGGENVFARDVEDVLLAHPDVREAAVVGGPHPRLGEEVVAFVVLRDDAAASDDGLREWLSGRLAGYKKPARVVLATELPRTPVGKVHKPELRRRLRPEVPA